jgi:hypothetical protein
VVASIKLHGLDATLAALFIPMATITMAGRALATILCLRHFAKSIRRKTLTEAANEIERLRAERDDAVKTGNAFANDNQRLRADNAKLRAIEKAAAAAYDYHLRGYSTYSTESAFNANVQLELMNELGRALEEGK